MNEPNKIYKDWYSRAVPVATVNEETRTVENVIASEDAAIVFDWERWEAIREILLMSGMVAPKQVPLLDSHSRMSTHNILGSTKNIRVIADHAVADSTFSSVAEREWILMKEGHLTDTSIGYKPDRETSVIVAPGETAKVNGRTFKNDYGDDLPLVIRTKWTLKENSVVPIGADQRAKFRSELPPEPEIRKENQTTEKVQDNHPAQPSARWMQNIHKHLKLKSR